jgi:hypothetical protein
MVGPQLPRLMTYPHISEVSNTNLNDCFWQPLADIKKNIMSQQSRHFAGWLMIAVVRQCVNARREVGTVNHGLTLARFTGSHHDPYLR